MASEKNQLIYSFVARGKTVLAEYTSFSGNFNTIAIQCLERQAATNNKFTYPCDGHTFNFLIEDGFAYMVMADEGFGRQIPFAYLEKLRDEFMRKYKGGKADTANEKGLNREFGPKIKELMTYCMDHPEELSKLEKIKEQVSEVKGVITGNIQQVLERGEKIEVLVEKTSFLRDQAGEFQKKGKEVRWQKQVENFKVKAVCIGLVVLLILIIWLSICHGFTCT